MTLIKNLLIGMFGVIAAAFIFMGKDKYPDSKQMAKKADNLSEDAKKAALKDYVK